MEISSTSESQMAGDRNAVWVSGRSKGNDSSKTGKTFYSLIHSLEIQRISQGEKKFGF